MASALVAGACSGEGTTDTTSDGSIGRIAFSSNRDGDSDVYATEVYVMDADGSNQTRLTDNPANQTFPAWSPDGTKIAFHLRRVGNAAEVYVMDADGSNQTRLTDHPAFNVAPAWSPDG